MPAGDPRNRLERLETIHATCVALERRAALLIGPSGAGKSDLALRCLGLAPGGLLPSAFALVADDRVALETRRGRLFATCPLPIRGRIEVRGLGIFEVASATTAEVVLIVDLDDGGLGERLPDPRATATLLGVDARVIRLRGFEASAPLKIALALLENKPRSAKRSR